MAPPRGRELIEAIFDLVGALKRRAGDRDDPATVFLLRHVRASTPLRISDLAAFSRLDVSTVSRHVKQLDDAGLLRRTEDPDDRRVSRLQITDRGQALLEEAMGARAARLDHDIADWSDDDRATLFALLSRLARSVNRQPLPTPTPTAPEDR